MGLELDGLKRLNDEKVNINIRLYVSTFEALQAICKKEGIRGHADIIRHLINQFIATYTATNGVPNDKP